MAGLKVSPYINHTADYLFLFFSSFEISKAIHIPLRHMSLILTSPVIFFIGNRSIFIWISSLVCKGSLMIVQYPKLGNMAHIIHPFERFHDFQRFLHQLVFLTNGLG